MQTSGWGRAAALLFAVAVLGASAGAPTVPPQAKSELAPAGKLRVAVLVTNPAFVSKDGSATEMRGVAADLGRELAKQLGASFEPVRYELVGKLVDGAKTGDWDVAFLGFEEERAAWMDFTAPYLEVGNTYLVLADSPIRAVADADKPGYRIAASDRSAQERYLTRNLKQAQVVRTTGALIHEGAQLLRSGKVHAVASNRVTLTELEKQIPGSRIVEGNFAPARHVLAVAKGRPAGASYAKAFIEHAKASGLVQQTIARAELRGVNVAARASDK
jgi:polar amino acid transport system substrate-binding protein